MKKFVTLRSVLGKNKKVLFGFELLFKLASAVIFIPSFFWMLDITMNLAGFRYLTAENIFRFLRHPLLILLLAICYLLIGILTLFDFLAVGYILDQSYHKRKTDLFSAVRFALESFFRLHRRKQTGIILLLPFFSLLYILPVVPLLISRLSLPGFLMRRLVQKQTVVTGVCLLLFVTFLIFCFGRYMLHYMFLEHADFKTAKKRSSSLAKKFQIRDLIQLLCLEIGLVAGFLTLIFTEVLILIGATRATGAIRGIIPGSLLLLMFSLSVLIFSLLGAPIGWIQISVSYYHHKKKKAEYIESRPVKRETARDWHFKMRFDKRDRKRILDRRRFRIRMAQVGIVLIFFVLGSVLMYARNKGMFNPNIEYVHETMVTAHRGASRYFPENTMAAFQGAVKQKADYLELDVHLSKDGQVFVMHDSNFRRTTGINAYAWEKDYAEIRTYDAGGRFHSRFKGERIPLLSEVIAFAKKNHTKLNIEIKPSKYEKGLEKEVVGILKKEKFLKDCVVTSQSYAAIAKVKRLDKDITTVYVMSYAYGGIESLEAADAFSIRSTSIQGNLVARIHNSGKQIYAWTVNSRYAMDEMLSRQVDNIITDNVPLALKQVTEHRSGDLLSRFTQIVTDLI